LTLDPPQNREGQESLTGEALPVSMQPGDALQAGSLVHDGTLVVRTTQSAANSAPARIAALTQQAAANRPRLELFLDRLTSRWSAVVLAALAASFVALAAAGVPLWGATGALYRCLALLTACAPCALVVCPLAYVCAMAVLTRHGVLLKGSHVIDLVRQVRTVALDKTGTVSQGRLRCLEARAADLGAGEADGRAALAAAAALSLRSQHPVSAAVLQRHHESREGGAALPELAGFGVVAGYGVWGRREGGEEVLFGSLDYVSFALGREQRDALRAAVEAQGAGRIVSVVLEGAGVVAAAQAGVDGGAAAEAARDVRATVFAFADVAEADSKAALAWLRRHGRGVLLLTGDNVRSAAAMAAEVGISEAELRGGLSPQDKAACVAEEQAAGRVVMMVGDGINDGPALGAADVGVAVASSTESAMTAAASAVIVRGGAGSGGADSFRGAVGAVALIVHVAWATRRVVVQNVAIALGAIVLAAVPAAQGLVPLWATVLVHEGSTVLVALNCTRILALRHPLRGAVTGFGS